MQNAAGYYVQPSEVVNPWNITEVFGNDFTIPDTLVSAAWANVSLSQSSEPFLLLPNLAQSDCVLLFSYP